MEIMLLESDTNLSFKEQIKKATNKVILKNNSMLTLHTKAAISLLDGDWRPGYMGLRQFANLTGQLWQAKKQGDPYAEWTLLKLFDAIKQQQQRFKTYKAELSAQLKSIEDIDIQIFYNPNPVKFQLNLFTPFANMGALLLKGLDEVDKQLFTLYRFGLPAKNKLNSSKIIGEVRNVFSRGRNWQHTGITRQDIHNNTPKARSMVQKFGKVPLAILNKEITLDFLPNAHQANQKKRLV